MKYRAAEIPERMKELPLYKGVAVPYVTFIDKEEKIHFALVNDERVWEVRRDKKCSLCGKPLDYYIAFMVTEDELASREIFENPSHEECLRYAFNACPWLYYSKARYSDPERHQIEGVTVVQTHPDAISNAQRPEKLGICITRGYNNVIVNKGGQRVRLCKIAKPIKVEWIEGK